MKTVLKLASYLFILLLLNGCSTPKYFAHLKGKAVFSKIAFQEDLKQLDESSLYLIEGSYNVYPTKSYDKEISKWLDTSVIDSILKETSIYHLINNYQVPYRGNAQKGNDIMLVVKSPEKIIIKVIDDETIEIKKMRGERIVLDSQIKGRLSSSGLFHLDKEIFEVEGIPYLFGGFKVVKGRLGLSKDNNLIFNSAYCKDGGFWFFSTKNRYNIAYEIERIE